MKIKTEDLEVLKEKCHTIVENAGGLDVVKNIYEAGLFPRSDKVKDLSVRFRWDIFGVVVRHNDAFVSNLYRYLNDNHIDTALKHCLPELTRKY